MIRNTVLPMRTVHGIFCVFLTLRSTIRNSLSCRPHNRAAVELDVYLLGVDAPVKEYTARIIGIVHRCNDVEDKLVAAPEGMCFAPFEIEEAIHFQEQYYDSEIESIT